MTLKSGVLEDKVRGAYSAAAIAPQAKHAFPVGRVFAEQVGYSAELLETLPSTAVEAFAGVSAVSLFAEIPRGAAVLDLGCGAGLDSLIAARRVGPSGKVTGVDFSPAMLQRARDAAAEAQVNQIEFLEAEAYRLPIADGQFDIALVNGIFNLNPMRTEIFRELARVVRPGGSVYGAELILTQTASHFEATEDNWFA